jgi:hypothetical protein
MFYSLINQDQAGYLQFFLTQYESEIMMQVFSVMLIFIGQLPCVNIHRQLFLRNALNQVVMQCIVEKKHWRD